MQIKSFNLAGKIKDMLNQVTVPLKLVKSKPFFSNNLNTGINYSRVI